VTRPLKARLLHDTGAVLGEGPSWDDRTGELVCVDILAGLVRLYGPNGDPRATYDVGGHVAAALPAADDGWLLLTGDGFIRLRRDGSISPLLDVEAGRPELRFNDAKCDPWGQALAGTMRYDEAAGSGTLYRLEGSGSDEGSGVVARVLLSNLGLANGMGWSPDGQLLYFVDSLAGTITTYPYAPDQELGVPTMVITIDAATGLPDGLCIDAAGGLWVALYGGGAVHRYQPDGSLDRVVTLPIPYPTSVAFGGPSGDRLFITTAGRDRRGADGVGGLWAVEPEIGGPPATPWRPSLDRIGQAATVDRVGQAGSATSERR
jgi:sugar lactone lactonase YvrE